MVKFLHQVSDWSEVWALLIPLFFITRRKTIPSYLKPIRAYVLVALAINLPATLIQKFKIKWGVEEGDFLWSNNFLYNTHSIIRLLLFSWFFILLKQHFMRRVKVVIPFVFIALAIINFSFYENFFNRQMLSSRLLAVEAAILLFYCLQYFIYLMLEDRSTSLIKQPGFLIVTGLSIYVAVNFFIFLFYTYLVEHNITFAIDIWDVHNIAYIILCICIARTFYEKSE